MAQTFHPSEEGNLEPIKTRIGEMVEKAKTLQASKFPADFDNEKIRKAVNQLVTDSQKLQKEIKPKLFITLGNKNSTHRYWYIPDHSPINPRPKQAVLE